MIPFQAGRVRGTFISFFAHLALSAAASGDIVRLKSFGYPEFSVWNPCGLIEGTDGMLYGVSTHGGVVGYGSIFRVNKDGSGLGVLHGFWYTNDGGWPSARLLEATNGMLYGTTSRGGASGAALVRLKSLQRLRGIHRPD